jgi:DNA-directed RNA polymerase specialized sigma subunit
MSSGKIKTMPFLPHVRFRTSLDEKLTTSLEIGFYHHKYQPQWVVKPDAHRALEQLKKTDDCIQTLYKPEGEPEEWNGFVIYLAQLWQTEQLAGVCPGQPRRAGKGFRQKYDLYPLLCAYLDEPAYRAVEKTAKSWKRLKTYTWEHWFFQVQDIINNPHEIIKIVENFLRAAQESQGKVSMEFYFKRAFEYKILEGLEQFGISRASDWRLLCMAKESELRQSLQTQGISDLLIERYIFAWDYFKSVYKDNRVNHPRRKKGDRWPNPHREDYVEVSRYYNQEKELTGVPLAVFQDTPSSPEQIAQWMQESVQALRNSTLLDEVNINNPEILDQLSLQKSMVPTVSSCNSSDLLVNVQGILTESLAELNTRFDQAIAQGEKPDYIVKILPLRYGIGLSQQDVGQIFGVHQSQISRRESDYIETLLSLFSQWLADKKGISLERMNQDLEQWLLGGYTHPKFSEKIQEFLTNNLAKSLSKPERALLENHYQKRKTIPQIASEQKLKIWEVEQALDRAKHPLRRVLCIGLWVETFTEKMLMQSYQDSLGSPNLLSDKILEGVATLTEEQQKIIRYVYGTDLSQEQVTQKLHCTANDLTRQLSASLKELQMILHLKLTELVTITVKTWLKSHYQTQVLPRFSTRYPEEYQLLTLYYQQRLKPRKIADRLSVGYHVTVEDVVNQLSQAEGLFLEAIQYWGQQQLAISLTEADLEKVLKKWF